MTEHEPSLPTVDPGAPLQAEECFSLLHDVPSDFAYADRVAPDGTVIPEWTTKGFTRITGYTCDELVQREEGFVIVHPDDLPILNEHVRQALATWANTVEVRIVTKWGDIRWIRSHLHPVWDAGEERVVRLRGWGEDITDRKLAEADRRLWTSVVEQLACPTCGVSAGSPCRTRSGNTAIKYHTPRFLLVPSRGGRSRATKNPYQVTSVGVISRRHGGFRRTPSPCRSRILMD